MTEAEFEKRVARLEVTARQYPARYRFTVLALALFGYGYLIGLLLLLLALMIGALASIAVLKAFAIKLALPIAAFAWMVLKALWVRIAPPQGYRLKRQDAPELFALIDDLRQRLRAPKFHRVLIVDEFNAAVSQVPRLGLFGWQQNYLLIGLPLMKTLTREQLTAVLAHEFGHLAGGHGRIGNWLYRLRMSWARLQQSLQQEQPWGGFMLRPFIDRYVPFFNAYSFPLARANEFEADAASVRLTSAEAQAQTLTAVHVMSSWLGERYWPSIHAMADREPKPAYAPLANLRIDAADLAVDDLQAWIERAMERRTSSTDTHPSLTDRLAAIGQPPTLALPPPGEAADQLLGRSRDAVVAALDAQWRERIEHAWEQRYEHSQRSRERLAELDAIEASTRSFDEAFEHATLIEDFGAGPDAALVEFRELQARSPDSALAAFALGQRLLARDDAEGVTLLEHALTIESSSEAIIAEQLRNYWWRQGDEERAHAWHARLVQAHDFEQKMRAERDSLTLKDKLLLHELDDEQLDALREALHQIPGLRKAYLVRKQLQHRPEQPLFILGFCVTPWWKLHRNKRAMQAQQQILDQVRMPGETLVVNLEGQNYRFHRKLRFRRGTRIV